MTHNTMTENLNGNTTRSFATEERLIKKLEGLGFAEDRHLRIQLKDGRWTAIFPASNIQHGNMLRYAFYGFLTMG